MYDNDAEQFFDVFCEFIFQLGWFLHLNKLNYYLYPIRGRMSSAARGNIAI